MASKLAIFLRSHSSNRVRVNFQTTACSTRSKSNETAAVKHFSTFQRIPFKLPSVKLRHDIRHSQQPQPRQQYRGYGSSARDNNARSHIVTKLRKLAYYSVILCSVGGCCYYLYLWTQKPQPPPVACDLRRNSNIIADIIEECADAVVNVVMKDTKSSYISKGSGFVVDEKGLILTNAHVVEFGYPRFSVQIRLVDGTVYPGIVEDIDVKSDLATIRIEPKAKLPVMKLGISKDLRPGEYVIAMGNPLSLSNTITTGIVSSVNRTGAELGLSLEDMNYIQTDASITYGNSGGPLVNLDGQVVGIINMALSIGIAFAIPIDCARLFLERNAARRSEGVTASSFKRYRGVIMLTLNEFTRQVNRRYIPVGSSQGALVTRVLVGSSAHRSGLRKGDVIVQINGSPVKSSHAVYEALEKNDILYMRIYHANTYLDLVIHPEDVS